MIWIGGTVLAIGLGIMSFYMVVKLTNSELVAVGVSLAIIVGINLVFLGIENKLIKGK